MQKIDAKSDIAIRYKMKVKYLALLELHQAWLE